MSFGQDNAGATLSHVTRRVTGEVLTETCAFDEKSEKNEKKYVPLKEPVIVFLPSGSVILLSEEEAERRGLMDEPDIIGIAEVNDTKSAAGKWKFAMSDKQRQAAWLIMEKAVIRLCTSRGGYPLDATKAKFSEDSIFYESPATKKKEMAA
jgi:hypothetical protein